MKEAADGDNSAVTTKKRVLEDIDGATQLLKRGPGGSSFMTCDNCQKNIACAIFDLHRCGDAKLREEQIARWAKADMEHKKRILEEQKRLKDSNGKADKQRKVPEKESKKLAKKEKEARDPNLPKKPPSSYMLFMNDFRPRFKEENPDVRGVTEGAKAGGARWKSMSEEEKKPYMEEAAKLKAAYAEQIRLFKTSKGLPAPEDEKENATPEPALEDRDEQEPVAEA
ncbi:high mobility group [Klebsormidium nitens]|uniref:High mobility group n=1 Tax=Klebsormidium nitens TaxID=105231 RepID=A0A1Y1I6G9_KLENI|nr:high mobility group [Klebsormidium nitens]|eukprot:GAQ86113.1 high mobility group [Klebsormidium nitens]